MRHSSEERFRSLEELMRTGQIQQLGQRLLTLLPPDAEWDHEDVQFLAGMLSLFKEVFGDQADPIYIAYAERLKSHKDDGEWLRTLRIRSEVVKRYEGSEATLAWLESLRPQMASDVSGQYSDYGYIDLLVGHLLREKGMLVEARKHLRRAVGAFGNWYLLDALDEMTVCLTQLGEARLAFEYIRVLCIQSIIRGQITVQDLYDQVSNAALFFGQIDYLIGLKRNQTHEASARGDFAWAAERESEASVCLAMIGMRNEAVTGLDRAADYAAQESSRSSTYFPVICRLLARYLDQTPLTNDELDLVWNEPARVIQTPSVKLVFSAMQENARKRTPPDVILLQQWFSLYEPDQLALAKDADGPFSKEICNHLSALLGRYYIEHQNRELAMRFLEVVALQESLEAICSFVRMDYADQLIRAGKNQQVLKICQLALARNAQAIHERFFFAQLAAKCCLAFGWDRQDFALGWDQQAFAYAKRALSDWRRILAGLFVEEHKEVWLERGASVISCLMEILAGPLSWLSEEERHREIFELMELGKARLMTDMVSHAGYVSGVYLFQEIKKKPDIFLQLMFSSEGSDWVAPMMLWVSRLWPEAIVMDNTDYSGGKYSNPLPQMAPGAAEPISLYLARIMSESGRKIDYIDPSALLNAFQLPRSPEKNLYTTAQSLPFEKQTQLPDSSLYDDLIRMMPPRGEET